MARPPSATKRKRLDGDKAEEIQKSSAVFSK